MRRLICIGLLWAATGCSLLFDATPSETGAIDAATSDIDANDSLFIECLSTEDCVELGQGSLCECGQCSVPTIDCGSQRRWPQGDRSDLSQRCVPRPTQIAAGFGHTCALVDDGTVRCWGENFDPANPFGGAGRIGDGTELDRAVPSAVLLADEALTGVSRISLGNFHSCALTDSGQVYCWGGNWFGVLGNGSSCSGSESLKAAAVRIDASGSALQGVAVLASGPVHVCVIRSGELFCWGNNQHLQVGSPAVPVCSTPTTSHPVALPFKVSGIDAPLTVAAGQNHTCMVDTSGSNQVRCFGRNNLSQLGTNPSLPVSEIEVPQVVDDGNGPLPNVKALSAAKDYTCAVDVDNDLYCWGENASGELLGATAIGMTATVATKVPNLSGVQVLDAEGKMTCVIRNNGDLVCGGENLFGQLMTDDVTVRGPEVLLQGVRDVAVGFSHICALTNLDQILCWGKQDRGRLGNGNTGVGIVTEPEPIQQLCPVPAS